MSLMRDIAKNTLIMFAVGIALAVISPVIAMVIGEATLGTAAFAAAKATPILWTGAFFGGFGGLHAAISPVLNYVFGDKTTDAASAAKADFPTTQPAIAMQQTMLIEQNGTDRCYGDFVRTRDDTTVSTSIRR